MPRKPADRAADRVSRPVPTRLRPAPATFSIVARMSPARGPLHMLQDYRLGVRMLLKYPGLTLAGGLALAIAIGIGAGWYGLVGKLMWPTIPLPDGDRIVIIETHNALANQPELRVTRDFLEWRSDVRSIDGLGAYRIELRNLIVGNTPPVLIRTAAL